jgi:hypothetical protein
MSSVVCPSSPPWTTLKLWEEPGTEYIFHDSLQNPHIAQAKTSDIMDKQIKFEESLRDIGRFLRQSTGSVAL